MAKANRMSDLFASTNEEDVDLVMLKATPPYSSEGPTLLEIGKNNDQTIDVPRTDLAETVKESKRPPATTDPRLYQPWLLLPAELLKTLELQARFRKLENIVPIVFTKNQNVKSGINRLKTYLGAYRDHAASIEPPHALKLDDCIIVLSARGDGATKLVGIVDMTRRIVAPDPKAAVHKGAVQKWWMYTSLTHVETARRTNPQGGPEPVKQDSTSEPPRIKGKLIENTLSEGRQNTSKKVAEVSAVTEARKVPVLNVWLTKTPIPAFEQAFGVQSIQVQQLQD